MAMSMWPMSQLISVLEQPAKCFYLAQATLLISQWITCMALGMGNMYEQAYSFPSVVRPTWMPGKMVKFLLQRNIFLPCIYSVPFLMCFLAAFPDVQIIRVILVPISFVSVWGFNGMTGWHKDFCMFYNICNFAFVPEPYQAAVSMGCCVHFILSTGVSKWYVSKGQWFTPDSMRAVFSSYLDYTFQEGAPAWRSLSRWMLQQDAILLLGALFTMGLELVLAPAAAIYPCTVLKLTFLASLLVMHASIFLFHSALITIMYFNNFPSYLVALVTANTQSLMPESGHLLPWAISLCIGSISVVHLLLTGKMCDENFPTSQFQLFAWAGWQWDGLVNEFWKGNTRMVMATRKDLEPLGMKVPKSVAILAGHQKHDDVTDGRKLFDSYLVAFDEAYVPRGCYEAFEWETFDFSKKDFKAFFDPGQFIQNMNYWMRTEQRMYDYRIGKPLVAAWWVIVDEKSIVTQVLHGPRASYSPPKLDPAMQVDSNSIIGA